MFQWLVVSSLQFVILLCQTMIKKWMVLEIINKDVFEIMTLSNNFVLICWFQSHVLLTLYDLWNMCFLLKYGFWELQVESWNMNQEFLNQTSNHIWKSYFQRNFLHAVTVSDYLGKFNRGLELAFIFSAWFFHKIFSYLILFQLAKFQCHMFFPCQDIKETVLLNS